MASWSGSLRTVLQRGSHLGRVHDKTNTLDSYNDDQLFEWYRFGGRIYRGLPMSSVRYWNLPTNEEALQPPMQIMVVLHVFPSDLEHLEPGK